jgi:heat shock protein HslJ
MKRYLAVTGLCVGLLILAACGSSGSQGDLTGKVWAMSELNGKPLVAGSSITAEFTADGQVSGSAGCNRYSGGYTVSGNKIAFSSTMASTRMMCEQAVMDQESAYFKALNDAKTYTASGDQLTLAGADKTTLAEYKAQSQDLAGSSWDVIAYNNGKQAVTSVMAGTALTADFGKDGTLSGNSGCNTYSGSYKVDGAKISIGPLASTMKACGDPAGVMEQEALFLAALQSAATYKMEGDALELRTADGALAVDLARK